MIQAFWFLTVASIRNRLRSQLARVKEPRYAIAMLLGIFYFWSIYGRPRFTGDSNPALSVGPGFALAASLLVTILAAGWWIFGGDRTALAFSPAEVQFLFPAPVSRRRLIQFKLLRAQPSILISTLIWVVLLRRGGTSPLSMPLRAVGFYLIFATLFMHRVGASLVRANVAQHGTAGARRSLIPLAIVWGGIAAIIWSFVAALPVLRSSFAEGEPLRGFQYALRTPAATIPLAPARWLVGPAMATTRSAWLAAILPALLIALVHYLWVVETQVAFEDAAVEATAKRVERLAQRRARAQGTVIAQPGAKRRGYRIPLAPTGDPAVAIVWKNIAYAWRTFGRSTLFIVVALAVVSVTLSTAIARRSDANVPVFSFLMLAFTAVFTMMGPLYVRNDLRLDLQQLESLRSWPIDWTRLVAAELASSVLVLSAMQLAFVIALYVVLLVVPAWTPLGLGLGARTLILVMLVIGLPLLDMVTLVIQNAVSVLFPAWVRPSAQGGGIESIGQNLLSMIASLLLLVIAWLVPAALAFAVIVTMWRTLHVTAIVIAFIVAAAAVLVEVWGVVHGLASVVARTEEIR